MRIIITTLLLALTLGVGAKEEKKPWDNGKLKVSDNQRYLLHENGVPFFWLGDTGWLLPERADRDEAAYYLKSCHAAGFNVVQVQVINGVPAYNAYGEPSHTNGWNFQHIRQQGKYGYWEHLDYIVRQAQQEGIYIGMVCIWGGLVKAGLLTAQDAVKYGTFLANRYKDEPNIIWFMGGDIQGDIHPEVWNTLATTIKSIDKNHLMTYHPRGRYTSAKWFSKAPWIDFHTFQSGHRRYNQRMGDKHYPIPDGTEEDNWMYVDSTWAYTPMKPVLDAEPSYEEIPQGLHDAREPRWKACDVRRYAYWSVFAGSCGHTYGNNSIMQFLKPGYSTSYGDNESAKPWYQALYDPGFSQMKHLKQLMLTFPYFDRIPDQTVICGQNGTRYDRLIATRGKDYLLVYNYTAKAMDIDFRKIEGKTKQAYWMDAATGRFTYLGEMADGIHHLSPTSESDGVLIAFNSTKEYLTPDMTTTPRADSGPVPISERPRILITTDIGGTDPDDNQSMMHYLLYSNEFDCEGLISSPSFGEGNKSEILRMIDLYEQDLPRLQQHNQQAKAPNALYPSPAYLRSITKQGRHGAAPMAGYSTPTEGSEWIMRCANKQTHRPLYILVWGGLDDVAQALHDAPEIAGKIRIYWIGGPNKKWGINAYAYIVENFPDVWMIENNSTYRGFIANYKNPDCWNGGFYDHYVKGNGYLGADFYNYLQGKPKLGDTPSLLYMMDGNPAHPEKESWGGSFERCTYTPRSVFYHTTTAKDTAQIYSIIEWHVKGPVCKHLKTGDECITLSIANQQWRGYYLGDGHYVVKYSTYKSGTQPYTITSDIKGFPRQEGFITIDNTFPGPHRDTDYSVGSHWWSDKGDPTLFHDGHQGAATIFRFRQAIMEDWGERCSWLSR